MRVLIVKTAHFYSNLVLLINGKFLTIVGFAHIKVTHSWIRFTCDFPYIKVLLMKRLYGSTKEETEAQRG